MNTSGRHRAWARVAIVVLVGVIDIAIVRTMVANGDERGATISAARDRVALVISNHDYGEFRFPRMKDDAAEVVDTLRAAGFRVKFVENLRSKELKTEVDQFTRATPTRGLAVCYFAGLGGQYQTYQSKGAWWNHLQGAGTPADARNPERDSVPLADVFKSFADNASSVANLLILDTPSDNPFLSTRMKGPTGMRTLESADLADDMNVVQSSRTLKNVDERSLVASAFAKQLPRGHESIERFVAAIVDEVAGHSERQQTPHVASGAKAGGRRADIARAVDAAWTRQASDSFLESELPRVGERPGQHWINSLGIVFCWCPPGKFRMGNLAAGRAAFDDAAPVDVELSDGFWIGKYEVTQIEADRLKAGANRYPFPGKLLPVHALSFDKAMKLVSTLNEVERKAGRLPDDWEYSLPTEAQWEYACRAGTSSKYSFGDDGSQLALHANYADKRLFEQDDSLAFADVRFDDGVGRGLAIVGSYRSNAWGVHDMHGNVAEWCADRYLAQLTGGVNPRNDDKRKDAPQAGVVRGGAWCSTAEYCEAGFRNSEYLGGNAKARDFLGFRLVLKKK